MKKPSDPSIRFWKYVKLAKPDECWEWIGGKYTNGYGQFYKRPQKITAHRFSYELINGEIIDKTLVVCHKCDNRSCVNPQHLFLGTVSDNMKDMVAKGRQIKTNRKGLANGRAKVTPEIVQQIKLRYTKEKISAKLLGADYGISETQTLRIINNESWKENTNEI